MENNKSPKSGANNTVFNAVDLNESHINGQQETAPSFSHVHHGFDTGLAAQFGIEEAILIHHFQYWITFNRNMNRNHHEDRTWTYDTLAEIAAHHIYMTERQVKYTINSLVDKGVLLKGNFNKAAMDKTTWYAFADEAKWLGVQNCPTKDKIVPSTDEIVRRADKIVPAIPHTTPLTTPNYPNPQSGDFSAREEMGYSHKLTPRELGTNLRAQGTNPRALGTNPRAITKSTSDANEDFVNSLAREWVKRRNAPEIAILEGQGEGSRAVSLRYNRQTSLTKLETPRLLNWINDRLREAGGTQWLIEADQLASV